MARIGGRNTWLAVPATLFCIAVVVGLVWFALPMIPAAVAWVGDTLRAATAQAERVDAAVPSPAELLIADAPMDCRDLYPNDLWAELVWAPDSLLAQPSDRPAVGVEPLVDALAPSVRVTCVWGSDDGTAISTSLARVADDAATVAGAALRGEGFSCRQERGMLRCARAQGAVHEEHAVRDGVWLATVSDGWMPEGYDDRLIASIWR